MHRILSASALALSVACAHAPQAACPAAPPSTSTQTAPATPPAFGFADERAFAEAEPLALYDVRWMLLTGDSGALVEMPVKLHSFTLGRWECALSAETAGDAFAEGRAQVKRTRRVACTHPTGLTMQSEVSCSFAMPSQPALGSPRHAGREAKIALGDAPALSLACEPVATERLALVKNEREAVAEVCVRDGTVKACTP